VFLLLGALSFRKTGTRSSVTLIASTLHTILQRHQRRFGRARQPRVAEAADAEEIMNMRANVFWAVFLSIISLGSIINAVAWRVQGDYAAALVAMVFGAAVAAFAAHCASQLVGGDGRLAGEVAGDVLQK